MLKHKPDPRSNFRAFLLFLLLFSVFFIVEWIGSTDGAVYTTFYASDYNILNGTYVSGSVPPSVASADADYFIARSVGTDTSINTYNPIGYSLLGSTRARTSWVSGSISNLTSNDGVHMVFDSYFSSPEIEDYVDNNMNNVDESADRGTHGNFTAQQYGPDFVDDILTEENSAGNGTLWFYVNGDDEGRADWTRAGTNPYLDTIDYNGSYVYVSGSNLTLGDFNFTDSGKSVETIENVTVQLYAQQSVSNKDLEVFVWNGSSWASLGVQTTPIAWGWMNWTAITVLNTWTRIDGAKIYIKSTSPAGTFEVDCARLQVDYSDPERYELDLEVQWISVDYDEANEFLCIYGGTMGAESIMVDVWNGSGWENLFTDLNSGWNNVSVTSYLHSPTFTIRFKGGTETIDTMQDTWNIDAALLHVWTDQYTAEVEFSGASNTYRWKQLSWTFDSAWTIGSVNVSIQLHNYTLGNYPNSGNGFMAYTSNTTANTDETKTQTITANAQHFRDTAGNWKIKVKAVKITATQFDFKADWVKFEPTYWSEYTVSAEFFFSSMTANTPIQLNFTVVGQYNMTGVNVTIQVWNYSASAYATSGEAYFQYTSSGANETKLLSLNTSPQHYISNGNTKIKVAGLLATTQYQQEVNQVKLRVSTQTSSQPSNWFATLLYVLPPVFGLLFLLALKLKRKKTTASPKHIRPPEGSLKESKPRKSHIAKKTDAFSEQFGMTHQQIKGKKMLLEIDPTSDNHKDVLSFVSETKSNNELLFILTNRNSTLHSAFSGDPDVKFFLSTSETSSPLQINERETLLPASDLSILLNSFDDIQKIETERTINVVFDNLSDVILKCGLKKTQKFIRLLLEVISSPKVTALFVLNPTAHGKRVRARIRSLLQKEVASCN